MVCDIKGSIDRCLLLTCAGGLARGHIIDGQIRAAHGKLRVFYRACCSKSISRNRGFHHITACIGHASNLQVLDDHLRCRVGRSYRRHIGGNEAAVKHKGADMLAAGGTDNGDVCRVAIRI